MENSQISNIREKKPTFSTRQVGDGQNSEVVSYDDDLSTWQSLKG